jgi:hypothetical protein
MSWHIVSASLLHQKYYKEYGLAIEGLTRHHKIDPLVFNYEVDDALLYLAKYTGISHMSWHIVSASLTDQCLHLIVDVAGCEIQQLCMSREPKVEILVTNYYVILQLYSKGRCSRFPDQCLHLIVDVAGCEIHSVNSSSQRAEIESTDL